MARIEESFGPKTANSFAQEFSDGFVAASGASAGLALLGALAGAALPGRRKPKELGVDARAAVPALESEGG